MMNNNLTTIEIDNQSGQPPLKKPKINQQQQQQQQHDSSSQNYEQSFLTSLEDVLPDELCSDNDNNSLTTNNSIIPPSSSTSYQHTSNNTSNNYQRFIPNQTNLQQQQQHVKKHPTIASLPTVPAINAPNYTIKPTPLQQQQQQQQYQTAMKLQQQSKIYPDYTQQQQQQRPNLVQQPQQRLPQPGILPPSQVTTRYPSPIINNVLNRPPIGATQIPQNRPIMSTNYNNNNNNNGYVPSPQSVPQQQSSQNSTTNNSLSATSTSTSTTTTTTTTTSNSDPDKRKLIQQQLVLLLHAHKCSQRTQQQQQQLNNDSNQQQPQQCQVQFCSVMKSVLHHMSTCNEIKNCPYNHCVSSRQIIQHWKNCTRVDCPVCRPLRNPANRQQPQQTPQQQLQSNHDSNQQQPQQIINHLNAPLNNPNQLNNTQNTNTLLQTPETPLVTREWHKNITQEMRKHLVTKIIQTILPINDENTFRDSRMSNFIAFARKTEREMYEIAQDQEDYFHLLAQRIYKIQKELEEKKRIKMAQMGQQPNQQQQQQPTQSTIPSARLPIQLSSSTTNQQLNNDSSSSIKLSYNDFSTDGQPPPNKVAPSFNQNIISSNSLNNLMKQNVKTESDPFNQVNGIKQQVTNGGDSIGPSYIKEEIIDNTSTEGESNDIKKESPVKVKKEESNDTNVIVNGENGEASSSSAASSSSTSQATSSSNNSFGSSKCKSIVKFTPEELKDKLLPTFEKLYKLEEAGPFQVPVDPVLLQLPDYFDIIKKPMDLSTIKNKLDEGKYNNPQEYVDDVWLMLNNAWLYNKKTSKVYKYCTKLSEVFSACIDPVMQSMGYCCGQQFSFSPQVLFCYGNNMCCTIPKDGVYFSYTNEDQSRTNASCDKYTYCIKCFEGIKADTVPIGDDPGQPLIEIKKSSFKQMKNDHEEPEAYVECAECGRKWHQICALHMDQIFSKFICDTCLKSSNKKQTNKFTSCKLARTRLGDFIENRVNSYIKAHEHECVNYKPGKVTIRILSTIDKQCEVKSLMKSRFEGELVSETYKYRTKAIFAFQEIDGVDVVFFGMHVQEYGSNCPHPNTRRVYISYLDSVFFFRPKELRTAVYHEILIGYLDYVKQQGYQWAHIWACPPSEGDDYIFHCHPPEQKVPKPKRLQDWYKKMLDKGIIERVVIEYKDIYRDALDNGMKTPMDIPYFEGDFWPNVLEDCIKEQEQEEEKRRKEEEAAAKCDDYSIYTDDTFDSQDGSKDAQNGQLVASGGKKKLQNQKKKNIKSKISNRKSVKKNSSSSTDLMTKMLSTMEKHKEVFFVIRLLDTRQLNGDIIDTDPLISCDLMNGRDEFLNFAREKHYEFSSLRRSKYSSMALLYELHNQSNDKFSFKCNKCAAEINDRYHCLTCDDFDLCFNCYEEKGGHEHKMEKLLAGQESSDKQGANSLDQSKAGGANQIKAQRQLFELYLSVFMHAVNCRNANCTYAKCSQFKRLVQHSKNCPKRNSQCDSCKQMIVLCISHAKTCKENVCQVPFCYNIKLKLKHQKAINSQAERRRMLMMNKTFRQSANSHSSTLSSNLAIANSPAPQQQQQLEHNLNAHHNNQNHNNPHDSNQTVNHHYQNTIESPQNTMQSNLYIKPAPPPQQQVPQQGYMMNQPQQPQQQYYTSMRYPNPTQQLPQQMVRPMPQPSPNQQSYDWQQQQSRLPQQQHSTPPPPSSQPQNIYQQQQQYGIKPNIQKPWPQQQQQPTPQPQPNYNVNVSQPRQPIPTTQLINRYPSQSYPQQPQQSQPRQLIMPNHQRFFNPNQQQQYSQQQQQPQMMNMRHPYMQQQQQYNSNNGYDPTQQHHQMLNTKDQMLLMNPNNNSNMNLSSNGTAQQQTQINPTDKLSQVVDNL